MVHVIRSAALERPTKAACPPSPSYVRIPVRRVV